MSIFGAIWSGLKWFGKLFTSKAAKEALELVNEFIPQVLPIVREIRELIPNVSTATYLDIKRVYQKFGLTIEEIKENPAAFGNALASLALTVARQRLNDKSTPTRIIKAAIELALVGLKSEVKA